MFTPAASLSPATGIVEWNDGLVGRSRNAFWDMDFFPRQNAPIDLALFYPGGYNV